MKYCQQMPIWNTNLRRNISYITWMLYNNKDTFYNTTNPILAIKVAQQLMYMKFNAIELRGNKVEPYERKKIDDVKDIIAHLEANKGDIVQFKEYVIVTYENESEFTLEAFKAFKKQQSASSAPASAPESAPKASESAPASAPALRETVSISTKEQARQEQSRKEQAKQLGKEAQVKLPELKPVPQKDLSNPTSKKFDIVGFTINKGMSSYAIPEEQKEKVLEVLPTILRNNLKDENVLLNVSDITINQKKVKQTRARIEFKEFLSIRETLQINDRKPLQPTQFETTGKNAGNPLNVWLFIVPATIKISENTNEQDKKYFEVINKLAEDELVKIASIMESIIERQKFAQSSRASSAQSPGDRGEAMTSRGPYRHLQTNEE